MAKEDVYINYLNDPASEKQRLEEVNIFKRVFNTPEGEFVLARMLEQLKFMEPCENASDMALNNFAKQLLETVYWEPKAQSNLNEYYLFKMVKKLIQRKNRILKIKKWKFWSK